MSAHANPDIVDDSLVFIYDTDDGKSFKGEPTVNLATDSPSQGGWAGGREVLDSSRKKFKLIVNNFNASAGSGQGWRSFTWDLNSYSGQSVTISATVEVPSASPGTFAWVMMGQTNTHTSNNSGAGQYMGYSAASERVVKTTTTTEHITWTGTVGSTGTASQPSGHVGFTLWYNGGTIGVDSYVEVSNVQIEINSHATQFVNGTRSATQGLLDRTGNTTINISNASFDSSAEMTFDGTDDIINTGLFSGRNPSTDPFTVEAVVRSDVTSGSKIWIDATSNGSSQRFYSALIDSTSHAIGIQGSAWSDPVPSDTNWHHQVIVMDGSTAKAYNNGELASSKSYTSYTLAGGLNIGGRSGYRWVGQIPIFKLYNRALTAAEVLQNFNATKSRFGL